MTQDAGISPFTVGKRSDTKLHRTLRLRATQPADQATQQHVYLTLYRSAPYIRSYRVTAGSPASDSSVLCSNTYRVLRGIPLSRQVNADTVARHHKNPPRSLQLTRGPLMVSLSAACIRLVTMGNARP